MTADQRAQLIKRIMKDDRNMKLSFKDCGKIAKDLNLSLEQVIHRLVYIYLDECVFLFSFGPFNISCLIMYRAAS